MTDVLCYSTVAGELPKLVANNVPMCFASWSDYCNVTNKLNSRFTNEQKESILKMYEDWEVEQKFRVDPQEIVMKVLSLVDEMNMGKVAV